MRRTAFFFISATVWSSLFACSDPSTQNGGSGAAAGTSGGGAAGKAGASGGGGTSGAAGGTGGSGAATGGGGGAGSGGVAGMGGGGTGGASARFTCPPGSESMSPTLPTQLNETHKITAVPPGGYTPDNIEGPVWIDGWLYMSEIGVRGGQNANSTAQPGRVIRYQPGGSAEPFFGGAEVGTNGLAVDENGFLVAAVQKDGSISRFDLSNPTAPPVPIAAMYNGSRFNSPNDLALRSDGNIYFSDPSYQAPNPLPQAAERAYRVTPSGTVEAITRGNSAEPAELPQLSSPNGVTLSKDENTLYVGHSGGLYKFDVMADGSVANGAAVPDIYGGVDGLGLDCAGNLYVTLHGNGEVIVLSPAGTQLGKITVSSGVTNVAFGGPGRTTLFVTKRNQPELYAVDVGIPGYPY